jgi:5,5'-dehydrodivanillate O-demethylase
MLTQQENELLTQTGAGTPMGDLLRRYWHPFAAASEMEGRWTKRVRLFGEDLVLFKDRGGRFGLVAEACPHRRASLAYGIPTAEGIRCPYHGWMFDRAGSCIEQPNEPPESTFKDKVSTAAYPVQELAGMLFGYFGPLPAPPITLMEGYLATPAVRMVAKTVIPCNWLQIMENSADPIHSEWLHGHLQEFAEELKGTPNAVPATGRHLKIAFDEKPYGIIKRRLKEGQSEDCDDWQVGHPLVFPNILSVGNGSWNMHEYQVRIPQDDHNTLHLWFTAFVVPEDAGVRPALLERVHYHEVPPGGPDAYELDMADHQDIMAWVTQGAVCDRRLEHLGATDRGITLFRRMLQRELEKVRRGEDPINVLRDPANATLELPVEHGKAHYNDSFARYLKRKNWKYSPIADDLVAMFDMLRERGVQRDVAFTRS